ncbi:MAG TPA: FTR1 family protein [Candidatus Limnocylindria bacterium]|nr:FTR1 family protein [Candidatus Limnocylindria bacterium]
MDFGALTTGLLTGLREGVEAALIVCIILAYLARTGNGRFAGPIWVGVAAAVVASLTIGIALFVTVGGLPEPYEQVFEGVTLVVAAGVVTWMLFWMRRQAGTVRGELQAAVARVLDRGGVVGLALLAFTAVIREGLETSIFLVGQVQAAANAGGRADGGGPLAVLLGALVGLVAATALGYGFYRGSRRIDLPRFFRWTGIALVFIAAGLLAGAIHEFIEIGAIGIGTATAYDLSGVLSDTSGVGAFLRALVGYRSSPELLTLAVHLAYLVVVLGLYLRPLRVPLVSRSEATTVRS